MGQGFRRGPRHAERPGLAVLRLDRLQRPRRRLPRGGRVRTRWSPRSTTACTARAAPRRRSTPPCTGWSTPPTSTTCTRTRASPSPRRRTGRQLTKEIFGDKVVVGAVAPARASSWAWTSPRSRTPTRRPSAPSSAATASPPGATPAKRPRPTRCGSSTGRSSYIAEHGKAEPFGPSLPGYAALPEAERRAKAAALAPVTRGLASPDKPQLGHFSDDARRPRVPGSAEHPRLAALGTSCPDHFLRTKVKPLVLDLPADAPIEELDRPAAGTPRGLPRGLPGLLRPERHPGLPADARRGPGDRPGPGRGHVLLRQRTSRPPGSPVSSTSTPST